MIHLKKHLPYLQTLAIAAPAQRKAIIATSSNEQIDILSELAANTLAGVIKLTTKEKQQLLPHAKVIRTAGRESNKLSTRKIIAVRHSEIIGLLVGMVIKKLLKHISSKRKLNIK